MNFDHGAIKTLNQEIRLANSDRSAFRWVVGGNYEHSDVNEAAGNDFQDVSTFPIFLYTGDISSTEQRLRNYAAFGNVEYDILPGLTLKGGARFTEADRQARACTADPGDGTFAAVFNSLANAIQEGYVPIPGFKPAGLKVPPVGSGCAALDNVTSDGTPITYLPGAFNTTQNENNVSWRVGIDYKIDPSLLLYVNISKGYKAGSVPLASAATFAQYQSVTQESLIDYETGFKFQTDNHALTLNGDIFYYDYTDKQERSKIVDPVFGLLDALENIPKSHLEGAEFEIGYRPISGLLLGVNASEIYSRVDKFSGYSASGQITNFEGAALPYNPKFQLTATADYQWTVGDFTPFIGATLTARSDASANIGGATGFVVPAGFRSSVPVGQLFTIEGYTLLDLRAGFETGPWRVSLYGKNVTNKYYATNIFTQYDTIDRLAGMPATYGFTVAYKM